MRSGKNGAIPVQCCREKIRIRPEIATPPLFKNEKETTACETLLKLIIRA